MKNTKIIIVSAMAITAIFLLQSFVANASEGLTDWYIKKQIDGISFVQEQLHEQNELARKQIKDNKKKWRELEYEKSALMQER